MNTNYKPNMMHKSYLLILLMILSRPNSMSIDPLSYSLYTMLHDHYLFIIIK